MQKRSKLGVYSSNNERQDMREEGHASKLMWVEVTHVQNVFKKLLWVEVTHVLCGVRVMGTKLQEAPQNCVFGSKMSVLKQQTCSF